MLPLFRRALLVMLALILIMSLIGRQWGVVPPVVIFIALLGFLEALERGWIRPWRGGGPPQDR